MSDNNTDTTLDDIAQLEWGMRATIDSAETTEFCDGQTQLKKQTPDYLVRGESTKRLKAIRKDDPDLQRRMSARTALVAGSEEAKIFDKYNSGCLPIVGGVAVALLGPIVYTIAQYIS